MGARSPEHQAGPARHIHFPRRSLSYGIGIAIVIANAAGLFLVRGLSTAPNGIGVIGLQYFLISFFPTVILLGFLLILQKRVEAGLREAYSRTRHMFDAAFDGIALHDRGHLVEVNHAVPAIFGYSREELIGKTMADLVQEEFRPLLAHTLKSGLEEPFEAVGLRKNGETITLEMATKPFLSGGLSARVTTIRDISERKHAEEALRKSEERLRTVVTNAPIVLLAFDRNGTLTLAEGKGLETLKMDSGDVPGHPASEMLGDNPEVVNNVRRALSGEALSVQVEVSAVTFEIHTRPVLNAESEVTGVIGIAVDISERIEAEEALRKSQEHLRSVISNAPIVLFALDQNGLFTLSEGKGLESLNLKPGEVVGQSAFDIYRNYPYITANIRRALVGEEFTATVETEGRVFETNYSPIFRGYGEIAGVIGVATDITDRKLAEDALRRSEEQLHQSQKMDAIGRVAGGVAHDFNNVLTAITGYSDLLLSKLDSGDSMYRSLEEIKRAADRATVLTRQLLAFSRKQALAPKLLDLNVIVTEMDKMLRRLIREDVEFVTILEPKLWQVKADPGQLEQVILNLALNARDAMPQGGQLTLETSNATLDGAFARTHLSALPGPYVVVSISDTGIGMDDEVKSHVFEPFFTTKETGGGLGLGLSTVYGIVKQSGGNITVESNPGKGATFRIFLPKAGTPIPGDGKDTRTSDKLKGLETVLLVEDEEAVRTLVREILQMYGYMVLEARHGGEALLLSERYEGHIHLLLTDVVMANMSGRELSEHLRPLRPEMGVLYISGYNDDTILQQGMLESGAAFLGKPFTPKSLAQKVRDVLDTMHTRQKSVKELA